MIRKSGTTLVEMMVVMSLIAVISIVGMRLFTSVNATQAKLSQQAILQMEAQKAFAQLVHRIRESISVIRPTVGETLPFMVVKDIVNKDVVYYLEPNNKKSKQLKQKIYQLVSYTSDYSNKYNPKNEHIILDSVIGINFTSLSPASIQMDVTVANEKGEAEFVSRIGLINAGGLD